MCLHKRVSGVCRRVWARVETAWIPLGIPLSWAVTQSLWSPGRGFLATRCACHSEGVSWVPACSGRRQVGREQLVSRSDTRTGCESQARLLPVPRSSPQTPKRCWQDFRPQGSIP